MVTFRLAGTLPAELVEYWKKVVRGKGQSDDLIRYRQTVEEYLDRGEGPQWLQQSELAQVVENALLHFDGDRYALMAWVVMPNHVHAVLSPQDEHDLTDIVFSWKSYTSNAANRALGRTGAFWEVDYFDRYIRDEKHLTNAVDYVEMNPAYAKLCKRPAEWQWSSARRRESSERGHPARL